MEELEDKTACAGLLAPAIVSASILASIAFSKGFRWSKNALSDLGNINTQIATQSSKVLFNGGLILGGLVALAFAYTLYRKAGNRYQKAGSILMVPTAVTLSMIGLFPSSTSPHLPSAISHYLLATATMIAWGTGSRKNGRKQRGNIAVVLGLTNIVMWTIWSLTGELTRQGLVVPETIGAAAFITWTLTETRQILREQEKA